MKIVYRVEDNEDRSEILCTTYQMRNFYSQFHDGFFSNLDVMNYIQHLQECYKIMKSGALMFLSCPNTPGNGYKTQYRAHIYEWGYDELKNELHKIGFEIEQEVGLIMGAKGMDDFFATQSQEIQKFYAIMCAYVPKTWLTAMMAIPYPKASREILFIVKK